MSEEIIMQTNPASRILVYSSSIDTARNFVGLVKAHSEAAQSASPKDDADTKPEETELKLPANPDIISHTLSNKYYTADVHFSLKSMQTLTSEAFHHTIAPPALIYVWTTSEPYSEHIQLLSRTMQSMEYEPDVCLGVRLAVASELPTSVTPGNSTADEEENTEIDSNLLSYGFEYVDASRQRTVKQTSKLDDEISPEESDENDDDVPDLPRVLDALSTIMWSTMRSTQSAQSANMVSNVHHLDDAEKEERDALLEELLAAGQDVRSAESQATKESVKDERKPTYDDDDDETLMQQMEAFIKDANALSSFSSFKGFGSPDIHFLSEHQFSPTGGLGSLDSTFDFSAFTGQPSQSASRSDSTAPLMDSRLGGAEQKSPKNKFWLDVDSKHTPPLNTHISTPLSSQNSSNPSTAITASPIDEESLESFGKALNPLPTITKHAFDDDFTDFVSAPISQPSTSLLSSTVDPSHLSLGVPSLRRSASRSSSMASDFGDHDDEHVYAMLDDASSYGGDDLDRDFEDEHSQKKTEESLPALNEILATTRQLFGGQIPVRNQGVPASDSLNSATASSSDQQKPKSSASQPSGAAMPRDAASSSAEALDLEGVLGALQRFKLEIGGMTDEEEKKRMAARVALGLVYGLEGQDETELMSEAVADRKM